MKLLTYNLWCDGPDYNTRLPKILEVVNDEEVDVIVFQEVKYGSYDTIIDYFKGKFEHKLDNKVKYQRLYGELVLSKYPITDSSYRSFRNGTNQRGFTAYKVSTLENDSVVVATTHLDLASKYNDTQARQINELNTYLLSCECDKVVMAGDFNIFDETSTPFKALTDANVNGPPTFVNSEYKSRPDRVYFKGVVVYKGETVKFGELSDHRCVIVEFF